jgi:hypothetical protein
MTEEEQNLEGVKRVQLVAQTVIAVVAVLSLVVGACAALEGSLSEKRGVEIAELRAVDKATNAQLMITDARINRLITIVEIEATLFVEPKASPEYAQAVQQLRAMRRINP